MSFFPVLLSIKDKKILLIGAGEVAAFKFDKICDYSPFSLTVVAREVNPKIYSKSKPFCQILQKDFEMKDLDGMDIVVVGINDLSLQQKIYDECQVRKIPCNCVDELDRCDFIFPSTIKRGNIVIAVSSSGSAPGFIVALREYIEKYLPDNLEEKLQEIIDLRNSLPSGKERMAKIREESRHYFNKIMEGRFK